MLVAEHRNHAAVFHKGLGNAFKESPPRVKVLLLFVPGVVSVLAHADHAIHADAVAADGQRLLDGVKDRHVVLAGHGAGHVLGAELVDVHRRQRQRRPRTAVLPPAFQDLADQHVGVQSLLIGRHHGRDPFGGDRARACRG